MNILKIKNLSVEYYRNKQVISAVKSVSLEINEGETVSVVGESGSGKSTLAMAIMGLIFPYEGKITSGEIFYKDKNLMNNKQNEWTDIRGKEISIVFQDPFNSLNPVIKVGEQLFESYSIHNPNINKKESRAIINDTLKDVMFDDIERIYNAYPHQLSGGQRQRIALAMAVINKPKILIADEPTTALDVTIQKEILDLIDKLKKEYLLTVIFITHNLAIASERSQRMLVMSNGEIIEDGATKAIFDNPKKPYTKMLIDSVPRLM
ncbi:MAG: ABC transporter ATP-binding protein [Elusimicrobia bacterium]|nr:ABC transporter ATP-binding protein [Elusimicrobiota bacterium]